MKKRYINLLVMVIGMCSACSVEQESITLPKNKKKYVSEQQCIEIESDIVVIVNNLNRSVNALRSTTDVVQQEALDLLSGYADGEKDSFLKQASKSCRTDYHQKRTKVMCQLERCNDEIQKLQQRLEFLRAEVSKIQSE